MDKKRKTTEPSPLTMHGKAGRRHCTLTSACLRFMFDKTSLALVYCLDDEQEGVFTDLRQMTSLTLSNNVISSVEPRVFDESANLTSLKTIDLSNNQMTELEPWPLIRTQITWTTVVLSNNRITNFANALRWSFDCNAMRHFVSRHKLFLHNNDVKHITDIVHVDGSRSIDGEILL